jgi:hypothetical protein
MPRPRFWLALLCSIAVGVAACSQAAVPSFDPTGTCTADGSAPGAYPDLEARVPAKYRDTAPERLDSGRNCNAESLGTLAGFGYPEIRFAGATWSFGAERALALVVFTAPGLQAEQVADFYADSARSASRTEVIAETAVDVADRSGRRLDTKTGERLQTVVVWPASEPDLVNVVITNDLPDDRIAEAIAAFGDR